MRYLLYLALLASATLNAAGIHKWTDADGNVHYSDAPPVTVKTESVRVQSAPSNPGKSLPRLSTPKTEDDAAGGDATAANNGNEVPADQAKIACDHARDDLKTIGNSTRVKLRLADGSTRYMTTEEIEERKSQAEADIERFCQ